MTCDLPVLDASVLYAGCGQYVFIIRWANGALYALQGCMHLFRRYTTIANHTH